MSIKHSTGMTIQSMEEMYYVIEARISGIEKTLIKIQADIDQCPLFRTEIGLRQERKRTIEKLLYWREQMLQCEEWLIDHEAKGWTST
jgi:hypothetical protein